MRFGHLWDYKINIIIFMDSEKDLLKQDLSNKEKPEEIKKFIEDVELLGHEDIAELGRKKLQEILEKADSIEKTSENQVAQVESMGGTGAEVLERTKEVDQKIEEVKTQTQEKITEVKNENKEEVKTETQEKTTEVQSNPEGKNKEYENKVFGLTTEGLKLDAQLDYLFLKKDIPGFTKLLVQKFEKEIEHKKLYNEQLKERELIEKQKDPSFNRTYEINRNTEKIKAYEERIESAKRDVTGLYEYNTRVDGRGSSANENINGLSPSQLAGNYNREIRHLMEENEKYSPSGTHDSFPHKFDKLEGLIDIAKQEGNVDLLNYIKQYGVKLPDEIKNKLNS